MSAVSATVRFEARLSASPAAAVAVSCLSFLALLGAACSGLTFPMKLIVAGLILAGGLLTVWRCLRPHWLSVGIEEDRIRLHAASEHRRGRMLARVFVSPFYVGLRWREAGRWWPRSFGIFRDQMNAEDYRRLCSTLRTREKA